MGRTVVWEVAPGDSRGSIAALGWHGPKTGGHKLWVTHQGLSKGLNEYLSNLLKWLFSYITPVTSQ